MNPIIIGITKDGKVDMTLDEFRKHMDDAYYQGYRENTFSLTATNDNYNKWWERIQPTFTLYGTAESATDYATNATVRKEG